MEKRTTDADRSWPLRRWLFEGRTPAPQSALQQSHQRARDGAAFENEWNSQPGAKERKPSVLRYGHQEKLAGEQPTEYFATPAQQVHLRGHHRRGVAGLQIDVAGFPRFPEDFASSFGAHQN